MHLSTKNQNETKEISGGIYPPAADFNSIF